MTLAEMYPFDGSGVQWDALVAELPGAHLLQTWEWSQVKVALGWEPLPFIWRRSPSGEASAQRGSFEERNVVGAAMVLRRWVLNRGFVRRLCILYVPKGPLLDSADTDLSAQVVRDLESLGRRQHAILVKIDPDVELGRGYAGAESSSDNPAGGRWAELLQQRGWRFSDSQIQFRNSMWIDLSRSEDELLGSMKQKTRYNVRLAERKGVSVRMGESADLPQLYRMYAETADRDGFVIRDENYYRTVWSTFRGVPEGAAHPAVEALVAEAAGEPIAAMWVFYFARRAYYLYGMSRSAHRDKMPNHLLQWEAIKRARRRRCRVYDLWGAPDTFDDSDAMWGVFRFKEGLGGYVVRTIGAWDFPSGGLWYSVYGKIVPRVLDFMRWSGRTRIHDGIGGA
jgi:peptidoglycan pentaglycine glycine transferase (the first glycine)